MEDNTLAAIVVFITALIIIFFSATLSALFGALAGWLVAFCFQATAAKVVASTGYAVYQLGAITGFVGSFFRPVVTQTK